MRALNDLLPIQALTQLCRRLFRRARQRLRSAEPEKGDLESKQLKKDAPEPPTKALRATSDQPARAEPPEAAPDKAKNESGDDLTVIRGIGISTQSRLNAAGILSYSQLARAAPKDVRKALGRRGHGAKVEQWIGQAKNLSARE